MDGATAVATAQAVPATTSSTEPVALDSAPLVQAPSGAAGSPAPSTTAVARPSGKTNAEIAADIAAIQRQYEIDSAKRQAEYEAGRRARLAECLDRATQARDRMSAETERIIQATQGLMNPPYSSSQQASWDQQRQNVVTYYNSSVQSCNTMNSQ
jgi:hypothetical protein